MSVREVGKLALFSVVLIEFAIGLFYYFTGVSISKLIYSFLILFLVMSLSTYDVRHVFKIFIIGIIYIVFALLRQGSNFQSLYEDVNMLLRSIFLVYLAKSFMDRFHLNDLKNFSLFVKVQKYNFYFISLLILVHRYLGIGGTFGYADGSLRNIYFSFFDSGNTLVALFIIAFSAVIFKSHGLLSFCLISVLALIVMLITGSKVGIAGVVTIALLCIVYYTRRRYKIFGNLFLGLFALGFVFVVTHLTLSINYFLDFLISYSSEGDKIDVSKFDVLDIIFSRRNIQIENSLTLIQESTLSELFFGHGLQNYKTELGSMTQYKNSTMVESDFLDILLGFGLTGVLLYFAGLFESFRHLGYLIRRLKIEDGILLGIMLVSLFVIGMLSGHVFLNTASSIYLGVLFSFVYGIRYGSKV